MVKTIEPVIKNNPLRERRKLILVGTEGKNKTEQLYFRQLERKQQKYHFIFASGNETDPINITRNIVICRKKERLNSRNGDLAISIFDLDADRSKEVQLSEAKKIAAEGKVTIITSNPCFEIWYLEHFGYTTRQFGDSADVVKQLKEHIPNYEKNSCDFERLYPHTDEAIKNCKKPEVYHKRVGNEKTKEFNNPRSDVYKLVEMLMQF